MQWYEYWLIAFAAMVALGTAVTIVGIGKERPPMTGGVAVIVVIVNVITLLAIYNVLTA